MGTHPQKVMAAKSTVDVRGKRSTERTGEIKDPFEHMLARPDMYIGSTRTVDKLVWVFKDGKIRQEEVKCNQGLLKIFEEPLSNSIDNKWRSEQADIDMRSIFITLNRDTGEITIRNDGAAIPAVLTDYELIDPLTRVKRSIKAYPAQVFFGIVLSGTNYSDDEERKTSGRNGVGAKVTNAFSTAFRVEHTDPKAHKRVILQYRNHAQERDEPVVERFSGKTGMTEVRFTPDFKRFGYPGIDDDLIAIITKSAYDCAMITGLTVTLNLVKDAATTTSKIVVKDLARYAKYYFPDTRRVIHLEAEGSECALVEAITPEDEIVPGAINHIAFVNGINTKDGGAHVDAWRDAVFPSLVRAFNARKVKKGSMLEGLKVTGRDVYSCFALFVRCEVDKPVFDHQTKNKLESPAPPTTKPSEDEIAKILKWDWVTTLEERLTAKATKAVAKKEGPTAGGRLIPLGKKGREANKAGGKLSKDCILYIVEGDSAMTWANAGVSAERSHDTSGILALKGKVTNASKATAKQMSENVELQLIKKLLGLRTGTDYSKPAARDELRYGKVCILTDADDDGFHIRGLVLNFFYTQFTALLGVKDFLTSFSTPVLRVLSAPKRDFYAVADYQKWMKTLTKKPQLKYYKGLGSFTNADAAELFPTKKLLTYLLEDDDDKTYMKLGFDPKESDWRKKWITERMTAAAAAEGESAIPFEGKMPLGVFVDQVLILYFFITLTRALPSIYDGFKESQRKIFYGIQQAKLKEPAKVAQLSGRVAGSTAYHHAETSLNETMIKMAQRFVGSNNVPLLVEDGQFGSRMMGGADAASPRYIFTKLEKICDKLYPLVDNDVLDYAVDDGVKIEPTHYVPLLPMALVNGVDGIAVGWSTHIPSYNPRTLCAYIRACLQGGEKPELVPYFEGYTGEVELKRNAAGTPTHYTTWGTVEKEGTRWVIKELPVGVWSNNYKEYLEGLSEGKDKVISGLVDYNTPNEVHFSFLWKGEGEPVAGEGVFKGLKKGAALSNMVLLDTDGRPKRYTTAEDIADEFYEARLALYAKRKEYLLKTWGEDLIRARARYTFVAAVVARTLNLNQSDEAVEAALVALKLPKLSGDYEYLLSMQMRSMTARKLDELAKEATTLEGRIAKLKSSSAKDLYLKELGELEAEL